MRPLNTEPITSRPPSPANEAQENDDILSPEEEEQYTAIAQCRRKSSSWSRFKLKRQLTKVNMMLTNTFSEAGSSGSNATTKRGSIFHHGPTEGTPLSPVEVSPIATSHSTSSDTDRSDFIADIEKDIVQSIDELSAKKPITPDSRDATANNSDDAESEPSSLVDCQQQSHTPRSILQSVDMKPRKVSQPQNLPSKKVDFSEETVVRSLATNCEGSRMSRPSELPLFDENGQPILPPRGKKKDNRDKRLLSVPNIKFNRQESTKLKDLRARSEKDQGSSFAGNIIRRFSKYQLRAVLQLLYCVCPYLLIYILVNKNKQKKSLLTKKKGIG